MDSRVLEEFLQAINEYFVTKVDAKQRTDSLCVFRSNVQCAEEADIWVKLFGNFTHTNWVRGDDLTGAPARYMFHNIWACQHHHRSKGAKSPQSARCSAIVCIKIKILDDDSKSRDRFLRRHPPLCAIININNNHNHSITISDSLNFLQRNQAAVEQYIKHFDDERAPCKALRLCETSLVIGKGPYCPSKPSVIGKGPYRPSKPSANTSRDVPTPKVTPVRKKRRKESPKKNVTALQKLKENVRKGIYKDTVIKIKESSPWSVLVVTNIMKRVHALPEAREIIFCESCTICDSKMATITVMLLATKAGALPLAVWIHENQTTESYTSAFSQLQNAFPNCFGNSDHPQAFMTENIEAMRLALSSLWPLPHQLLSQFHVTHSHWRWLLSESSGTDSVDWKYLMKLFKEVMCAISEEDMLSAIDALKLEAERFPEFVSRITSSLETMEDWVLRFRDTLVGRSDSTFAEITIRIVRDVILNRTKVFDLIELVEFCVKEWEGSIKTGLRKYTKVLDASPDFLYEKFYSDIENYDMRYIRKSSKDTYLVPVPNENLVYTVHVKVGICTCYSGYQGGFCHHQALIQKHNGSCYPPPLPLTVKDRYILAHLALRHKCPSLSYFAMLQETPGNLGTAFHHSDATTDSSDDDSPCGSQKAHSGMQKSYKEALKELECEITRLKLLLGKKVPVSILKSFTDELKKIKTGTQVVACLTSTLEALMKCHTRPGPVKE